MCLKSPTFVIIILFLDFIIGHITFSSLLSMKLGAINRYEIIKQPLNPFMVLSSLICQQSYPCHHHITEQL